MGIFGKSLAGMIFDAKTDSKSFGSVFASPFWTIDGKYLSLTSPRLLTSCRNPQFLLMYQCFR